MSDKNNSSAPSGDPLAWWTSIETDTRKSLIVGAQRDTERLHALLRMAYEAGRTSAERAPSSAERVQWQNIQRVVNEVAKFCFGDGAQAGQISLGAAYTAVVTCLTASDGLDVKLVPLPAPASAQEGQGGLTDDERQTIRDAIGELRIARAHSAADGLRAILARQTAPTLPHQMAHEPSHTPVTTAYINGWNDCRDTMAGCIPDDPTNHAAPQLPVVERTAVPEGWRLHKYTTPVGAGAWKLENSEGSVTLCVKGGAVSVYCWDERNKRIEESVITLESATRVLDASIKDAMLAAAPAAQEGKAVDGWISVKDRKPESGIAVLVIAEGWERPCVAAYFKKSRGIPAHWQDEHGDNLWPPVPTYWTPLPKLPDQQSSAQKITDPLCAEFSCLLHAEPGAEFCCNHEQASAQDSPCACWPGRMCSNTEKCRAQVDAPEGGA